MAKRTGRGYVYFIHAPSAGVVKIGYSMHHPDGRLFELAAGSPVPLERMGWLRGGPGLEEELHARFSPHASHREWFHLRADLSDFTATGLAEWKPLPPPAPRSPAKARPNLGYCFAHNHGIRERQPGHFVYFLELVSGGCPDPPAGQCFGCGKDMGDGSSFVYLDLDSGLWDHQFCGDCAGLEGNQVRLLLPDPFVPPTPESIGPPEPSAPLLPCPFCGGEPLRDEAPHGSVVAYFVACRACACEGPWDKTRGGADRLWDARTSPAL